MPSCFLYPATTHPFIDCAFFCKLCKEHSFSDVLVEAKLAIENNRTPVSKQTNEEAIAKLNKRIAVRRAELGLVTSAPTPDDENIGTDDDGASQDTNTNNELSDDVTNYFSYNSANTYQSLSVNSNYSSSLNNIKMARSTITVDCKHLQIQYNPDGTANNNKAITDSGATETMSSNRNLFEYIVPLKNHICCLGDDKTKLQIMGYVIMNFYLINKRVRLVGYYIPDLGTTLISIKQHMNYKR